MSCTCSLHTASARGDGSHGSKDDCCSKTKADRLYRNQEEDDDDDFIIESMMLNFDDAEYR